MKQLIRLPVFLLGFLIFVSPLSAQFGRNKVRWNTPEREWMRLKGPNVDVLYYRGANNVARMLLEYAESSYDTLKTLFGVEPEKRPVIVNYVTGHVQETNIYPGFLPGNVAGFFENVKDRIVAPFSGNYHWFRCVSRHELVHSFQTATLRKYESDDWLPDVGDLRLPLWWTEGLAEYWAGNHETCRGIDREIMLRDMVVRGSIPSVSYLTEAPIYGTFLPYLFGIELHKYLGKKFGDSLAVKVYEKMSEHNDFEDLIKDVYGIDFRQLTAEFHHELRSRYAPQYSRESPPPNMTSELFAPSLKGTFVSGTYKRDSTEYILASSGYSGYPTLYGIVVLSGDSLENRSKPDTLTDSVIVKCDDVLDCELPLDTLIHVLARGGRRGYESINPWADVYEGKKITIVVKDKQSDVIVVRDIEENKEIGRYRFELLPTLGSLSWGPNGERIVFSGSLFHPDSANSGVSDLYIFNPNSKELEKLTNDVYFDGSPQWSPDGRWILFESDRTEFGSKGYVNLFLLNPETGRIRYLTHGKWRDYQASWSEDGTEVIFVSDRSQYDSPFGYVGAKYDIYTVNVSEENYGKVYRLTDYFGSAFSPQLVSGDSVIVFNGYSGGNVPYIRERPLAIDSSVLDLEDSAWQPTWNWEMVDLSSDQISQEPHHSRFSLVNGFASVGIAAGHGSVLGGGVILTDDFDDQYLVASFGASSYSYLPNYSRFGSSLSYINFKNRFNYSVSLFGQAGPLIDVPRRHIYRNSTFGASFVGHYPFSQYDRLEFWSSLAFLKQNGIRSWSYEDDLQLTPDSINFDAKGLVSTVGLALVGDNTLWLSTGPVTGTRYRLSVGASANASSLVNSWQGSGSLDNAGSEGVLHNYILYADFRHYFRFARRGTYAIRAFGFLSGGEVPTRISISKLGGMAAFYPWYTPYGSRIFAAHQRLSVPFVDNISMTLPALGRLVMGGIQGSLFVDAAWVSLEDRRGIVWGDYGVGLRIPTPMRGVVLRLDWGKIFTAGRGYKLPERYRGMKFGWWMGYEF